ncbi:MAG: DUF2029 domain-containing protein [Candidatus Eremiobacteraeota bacterium]|nr:DUF2029 domain-containing protein [Candidatus Eremiobacteraeota bacterium]
MKAQPVFALAIALISLGIMARHVAQPPMMMADFRAFACTGSAVLHHVDPYSNVWLAACEAPAVPPPLYRMGHGGILPAPLPGYLVALFLPFAAVPLAWAAISWGLLLCLAIAFAIMYLERLELGSRWTLLVVLAIPLVAVCVPLGELPPIALAGVALLAWAVKERRYWAAGAGLALTMAEPSVGLCVALAVCALSRRYCVTVGATLLILLGISVATVGLGPNLEYVRSVLPAHIYAELPSAQQFSLSWVFDRFGTSAPVALFSGKLWYVLMLVLSVAVARARASTTPEFGVLAAAAFAVLLGPYMHLAQIGLAVPAALWLAARAERPPVALVAAAVALAVPLLPVIGTLTLIVVAVPVAAWVAAACSRRPDIGLRAAAVTTLAVALAAYTVAKTEREPLVVAASPTLDRAQYVRRNNVASGWSIWLLKLPSWYATITVAGLGAASSFRKVRVRRSDSDPVTAQ